MKDLKHSIESNHANWYEWGECSKPAIVCLHGLGNNAITFSEMAEFLTEDYYVLAFDGPGHGKTPPFNNEEDYLFSNLAKWYDDLFQQVLEKPFYILGHSWGADIALHYTKQYPKKVKGVILLDGGFIFPDYQDDMTFLKVYEGWDDYMDHCTVFDTWKEVVKEYKQYTNQWNEKKEWMVSTLFNKKDKYKLIPSKFTILSIIKAFFKVSFTTTYPYIQSPLLLLHSTHPKNLDNARLTGITQLKQHLKDVRVVSMDETNHMVHWDNPRRVAAEIHRWITGINLF